MAADPRRLGSLFQPEPAQHEGIVNRRAFTPTRGFMFLLDEKERQTYFLHINDCAEAVFRQLQPGMRVAFGVFSGRDGKFRAHRVRVLE